MTEPVLESADLQLFDLDSPETLVNSEDFWEELADAPLRMFSDLGQSFDHILSWLGTSTGDILRFSSF